MAKQDQAAQGSTTRNALVVIAVVVTGAAVYWLSAILTPLALALFLMIMIDSFARVLRPRLKFPAIAAMPLAWARQASAPSISAIRSSSICTLGVWVRE